MASGLLGEVGNVSMCIQGWQKICFYQNFDNPTMYKDLFIVSYPLYFDNFPSARGQGDW